MTDQNTPKRDMTLEEAANIIEFMLGRGEEADRFGLNNRGVANWHNVAEGREALEIALIAVREKISRTVCKPAMPDELITMMRDLNSKDPKPES